MSWQIIQKATNTKYLQNNKQKLIINADDFGYSAHRDRGILQLINDKKVTSISVIMNGINIQNAVQNVKKIMLQPSIRETLSVGLHFNLTEGAPLSKFSCPNPLIKQDQFLGKKQFYVLIMNECEKKFSIQIQQSIKNELRAQIIKFIDSFKFRPSHIDGHNHVHIIPQICELICPIMSEYGIYKSRLPVEVLQSKQNPFNEVFVKNAKLSKSIFDLNGIQYAECFVGLQEINTLNIPAIIQRILTFKSQKNNFTQLMCHPGYSDPTQGDQFNRSKNRQTELNSLKHFQLSQLNSDIQLKSFNDLTSKNTNKKSILLYSKMNVGSGNWTSSLRLKTILQSIGYRVYLRSIQDQIDKQTQIQSLRAFLFNFGISLVIGVNLTRSALIIYNAARVKPQCSIVYSVPYILIIAGTDANSFFDKPQAKQLGLALKQCSKLISLSVSMQQKTKQFLSKLNIAEKKIDVIVQSSNISEFQVKQNHQYLMISELLKRCYKVDLEKQQNKYILFPTSFRKVKDIENLLTAFNNIIDKYHIRVFIVGPILNQSYFETCRPKLSKVQYLGVLGKNIYFQLLKKCMFVVNTSITEGMSCSINESLEIGKIYVCRQNQGNCQMVKHQENGFIYSNQANFIEIFLKIYQNKENYLQKIQKQAKQTHYQKYSICIEINLYKKVLNKMIQDNGEFSIFQSVHPPSNINLQLFKQIPINILQDQINKKYSTRIIDIGCGTGVFLLTVLQILQRKQLVSHLDIQFYDIESNIMSNCLYNIRQSVVFDKIKSFKLGISDMFSSIQSPEDNHIWLANLPQTPFRNQKTKPDKNGGTDSLKFNQLLLRKFSKFGKNSILIMLYSYMANPHQFFKIVEQLKLKIIWRSQKLNHQIKQQNYDKMQENLSQFIKEHIKQKKAEVTISGDTFKVPAQILILTKGQ